MDIQQKPKTFVVINPMSGTLQPEVVREKIQTLLQAHEIPFSIYETTDRNALKRTVHDAIREGFELFIGAGGDGTLAGIAGGLVGTQLPLMVVPTGTWNVLARNLNIPLQMDQALELLFQEHQIRAIDTMEVDEGFYILNISAGVSSHTVGKVSREVKRRIGKLADLWNGFQQTMGFPSYRFDLKIDGTHTVFRASQLMVANGKNLVLQSVQLDKQIHMDDGKLNVCRIYAKSLRDYLDLAISLWKGEQDQNWKIFCLDAFQEVEIRSSKHLPVQGDGELIGYLPVTVRIHPRSVHVVTPPDIEL